MAVVRVAAVRETAVVAVVAMVRVAEAEVAMVAAMARGAVREEAMASEMAALVASPHTARRRQACNLESRRSW